MPVILTFMYKTKKLFSFREVVCVCVHFERTVWTD